MDNSNISTKQKILDASIDLFSQKGYIGVSIREITKNVGIKERLTPNLEKTWRIIYMEQFRDSRARDFVLCELHARPLIFYERVFSIMMEKGLVKSLDPKVLAYQYNYPLTIMSMEYIILKYDNKDVSKTGAQMIEHIRNFVKLIII